MLDRAASVSELDESLKVVKQGLNSVNTSLEKYDFVSSYTTTGYNPILRLRLKIHVPHENLANCLSRLQRLQIASDALRRASRFIVFARRLESQISELDRVSAASKANGLSPQLQPKRRLMDEVLGDAESDKERIIVQAAFNVAEIGRYSTSSLIRMFFNLRRCIRVAHIYGSSIRWPN